MDLSVLIAARQEIFLARTIDSVLSRARGKTEVIAVLDGAWADPPVDDDPRVTLLYRPEAIGQRAAVNVAARCARAKYVMKLDAHCIVDEGFDLKLMQADAEFGRPDVTQIPAMMNVHAFDWRCVECGERTYQGPYPTVPCVERKRTEGKLLADAAKAANCQCRKYEREMVWAPRESRRTEYWRFDHDLHFQYWSSFKRRPEAKGEILDMLSSLGACFYMRRERFWELGGLDEGHGSWGQFGTEIACKSWLSGGRHVVNKRTWFAHLFRTQGADFSFPYKQDEKQVQHARQHSQGLWLENRWPGQVRPLSWLIDKFKPLPDWHEAVGAERLAQVNRAGAAFLRTRAIPPAAHAPTVGLLYYSDCQADPRILEAARAQLRRCANGYRLVSVTLAPVDLGENIVLRLKRGYATMFRQILTGLEALETDIVFLVEHDMLYAPEHFAFRPPRRDQIYYNQHTWKVNAATGHALHYRCNQTSGLCAYRDLLLQHYRTRVERVERNGRYDHEVGFEPGTRSIRRGGIDDLQAETWISARPNIDIRHGNNLTRSRWTMDQFRNKDTCKGWTEADEVPGWGKTEGRFAEFLADLA